MGIPYCTENQAKLIATAIVEEKGTGSTVSVSTTGTATDDVKYITINGTEHRMATNAYQPFPSTFVTNSTTQAFGQSILAYSGYKVGACWHGELTCTDLPAGLSNVECTVSALTNSIAVVEMFSSNREPFYWQYNTDSWNRGTGYDGWKYAAMIDSSKLPSDAVAGDICTIKCKKLANGGWEFYAVKD